MIGASDWFGEIFGSSPTGDISWNARVAKSAVRSGLGVVLIYPNDKVAACTLTSAQAQKADLAAQDVAKEAGNLGWANVKHKCGVDHVITDEKDLNKVGAKKLLADGANVALAPGKGEFGIALADLDTAVQVEAFRRVWNKHSDEPIDLTVSSPGVVDDAGTWRHKDGGHVWFSIPDGIEMPERKGRFTWCECHAFRPWIDDPKNPGKKITCPNAFAFYWGSGYALVPPSVRPEGPYRYMGSAVVLPDWLSAMAGDSVAGTADSTGEGILGRFSDDPIDTFSREIEWSDILIQDGFTPAGMDNCGCPTFTRPGDATHSKSVTAHEMGCSLSWPDTSTGHLPMHIWSDALGGDRTMSKLSWIAENRFGGDMAAAMRHYGINRLREMPNIDLWEGASIDDAPKAGTLETIGGTTDELDEIDESDEAEISSDSPLLNWWDSEGKFSAEYKQIVLTQFMRERAREYIEEQTVRAEWTPPDDEDDFSLRLLNPEPAMKYAIEDVLPVNGNAMIFAQYKTGKTTFVLEVVRSLVDRSPFLGTFGVNTEGNVALWNYELAGDMMDSWLRDVEFEHPERLRLLNLRGKRIPMHTKPGQKWVIKWLRDRNIRTWIIDPAVRAMIGWGDENDNNAVTLFTDMLDEIKDKAGVSELIIAHHTGRAIQEQGEERARGATRWDDWPDSRWILTKINGGDTRFIRMLGRGKDLPERALSYEAEHRRLTLVGGGDPLASADRATFEDRALATKILDFITANPGLSKNKVMDGVGLTSQRKAGPILSALVSSGKVYTVAGPNKSQLHYAGGSTSGEIDSTPSALEIES